MTSLSRNDLQQALTRLLPPGRAMQALDGTIKLETSILRQVTWALAGVLETFEQAMDAALAEFFCATADQDRDVWLIEYGLPDECDPFGNNLCAKASFIGGSTIEDFVALSEAMGWASQMRWLNGDDDEFPDVFATLHVVIDTSMSPAFESEVWTDFGNWVLPTSPLGPPDTSGLICALLKAIPAHCALTYEVL